MAAIPTMPAAGACVRKPFVARTTSRPARCIVRCAAQKHCSAEAKQQTLAPQQLPGGPQLSQWAQDSHLGIEVAAKADMPNGMLMLAALLTPLLVDAEPALAGNPLLTGKAISLVHPTVMFSLLGVTIYTGILGWNYRQARLIPAEVKDLKAQLPSDEEAKASSPLQGQIKELESKRKQLLSGDPRGKHFLWSSLLLGMGSTFAVIGPLNTYLRAGKLFPGPHLYTGASMIALWGIAASMTPLMSRNNDVARNVHITANVINTGLFVWQVPTGLDIVFKVFENVPWP